MRILICSGIYPPAIGGPAKYARCLFEEFSRMGHDVRVLTYGLEKKMPVLVRHCYYFFRALLRMPKTDFVLALDTFSAGWPAVCAARFFGRKIIIRLGGDFLWESYVEKTGRLVTLKDFYVRMPRLPLKQRMIFSILKFTLKNASALVFSTDWQRKIFMEPYGLNAAGTYIIENYYGEKAVSSPPEQKNFLWSGRPLNLKNIKALGRAFALAAKETAGIKLESCTDLARNELMEKIKNCYAVIQPSVSDVSPNFILEALQFGKPFILTSETGFYEKLRNVGLFVNPLDENDIKEKIIFLADSANYEIYKKKAENFRFTHSWREIAGEFLAVYQKLCA